MHPETTELVMDKKFTVPKRYQHLENKTNVWIEFNHLAMNVPMGLPVNLGQGTPSDVIPELAQETMREVVSDPSPMAHQYTAACGHPRLVKALASFYTELLLRPTDIRSQSEVLITNGAYEALFTAISGFVEEGDEVIIIEPFFDCYEPMVRAAGGCPRFIALKPVKEDQGQGRSSSSAEWALDPDELRSLFNAKTKAIIVNNPNNPVGKVFKRAEIALICGLCMEHDVLVIADEVYEHMVYKGSEMLRVATMPGMWERTITIGSAGKSFSVTGWRIGWAIGPPHLIKNCKIVHVNSTGSLCRITQEAVARLIEIEDDRLSSKECFLNVTKEKLQRKRDTIARILLDSGLKPVVPEGGYFIMADWRSLSSEEILNSEKDKFKDYRFAKWLCKTKGVQGIPLSAFYSDGHKHLGEPYIRFCFIKHDKDLKKLEEIFSKM